MRDDAEVLCSTQSFMNPDTFTLGVLTSCWPLKFSLSSQLMRKKSRGKSDKHTCNFYGPFLKWHRSYQFSFSWPELYCMAFSRKCSVAICPGRQKQRCCWTGAYIPVSGAIKTYSFLHVCPPSTVYSPLFVYMIWCAFRPLHLTQISSNTCVPVCRI